ncbi:MAG: hypothetical protein JXR94_11035, partial [Candidatus Hydrogenedentes bacterium]|nr:hypothetical protein [Candidatus Hydrogenedentota bacterium]
RSRQVLRLLKSGGEGPPEGFLLAGVLEEELERWLLPRLASAPVCNIAHEMAAGDDGLPGGAPQRLDKALGQIKRGKPRKEICKPPYAAEILWAFRAQERYREAVGAERLSQEDIEFLCRAMSGDRPDYAACLRLIARAVGPA